MFCKEVELKIKFEYEGQKRVILLPQPVKYKQLIDKLHQLCGSLFTIEFSAAEGQFIREVECQEDLDDVIDLTKNNEKLSCLPLKLVPCLSSSSSLPQLPSSVSSKPTVKWSSSVIGRMPEQSGGFFKDESSDPFPASGFKPCLDDSPPPGIDSSPLKCTPTRTCYSKPENRVDYIPEINHNQTNEHPSIFIPDYMDYHASCNYNSKKKSSEKQIGQCSLESGTSGPASAFTRHVRSKSDSQGTEVGVSAFLSSLKHADDMQCLPTSCPLVVASSTTAERGVKSPCSSTPATSLSQVRVFSPPGSRTIPAGLTSPPMDKSFQTPIGHEVDSGFSSNCMNNEKQKKENGEQAVGSFSPGNWVKGKLLGRGAFGQVFTGYDVDRGVEFAVKQVQIYSQSNEVLAQIKALEMEISVLQGIHNDHVVEYYGMQREPECLSIFIEFIPMGSLRDHINRYGMLTEKVTGRYTNQILKGLAYLHSKMIVHRDIKSANILRDHHGNLKLGDFGAAKLLQSQSIAETSAIAGTPYFMAPEVIRGEACGCRSDIWSLGCTVVEMLTKNPPWYKYNSIAAIYRIGNVWPPEYELSDSSSDNVKDFMHLCFAASASSRPRAEELLVHAFITQNL